MISNNQTDSPKTTETQIRFNEDLGSNVHGYKRIIMNMTDLTTSNSNNPTESLINGNENSSNAHGINNKLNMISSFEKDSCKPTETQINGNENSSNAHGLNNKLNMISSFEEDSCKPTEKQIQTSDDETSSNAPGLKNQKTNMKVHQKELEGKVYKTFTMKSKLLKEFETYYGYIQVREKFAGYDQWDYRPPTIQAKKMFEELKNRKCTLHREIYYILQLMKWSMGQNDFEIPMTVYQEIMRLKDSRHLMTEGDVKSFTQELEAMTGKKVYSTIWSNHKNFNPYKRIQFRFKRTEMPKITTFDEFVESSINFMLIKESNNFKFMNKEEIVVRFNGINYSYEEIDFNLISQISNSLYNQSMSIEQIVQTSTLMATLKLIKFTPIFTHYEDIIINYISLVIDMLRKLTIKGSVKEIATEIINTVSIIPVNSIEELKEYVVIPQEVIEKLFTHKTLIIDTRIDAEYAEMQEGILMRGDQKKFCLGKTKRIGIAMVTIKTKEEDKLIREVVNHLERRGNLRDAMLEGYNYSKTIKYMEPTFNTQHGRTLPRKVEKMEPTISDTLYIHLTDVLTKKNYVNDKHPGLLTHYISICQQYTKEQIIKLNLINKNQVLLDTILLKYPEIAFHLKLKERYAQAIAYAFELEINTPYATIEGLKKLLKQLEIDCKETPMKVIPVTEEKPTYEDNGLGDVLKYPFRLTKAHYYTLKGKASSIYETISSIDKTKEKIEETMDSIKETATKFAHKLDQNKMTNTSRTLINCEFKDISSTFDSVKVIISAVFNDLVNKIASIVGITIDSQVDAYQLFVYYLLWKNTDCNITKTFIVLDILASFGVLDKLWEILVWVFNQTATMVKGVLTYEPNVREELVQFANKTEENIATQHVYAPKVEDLTEEDEQNFFSGFIQKLEVGAPSFLALLGTGALIAFGCKSARVENSSEKFTKSMKHIALLGLTFTALPKIYSSLVQVIIYVMDQVKGLVNDEHQTETALIKRFGTFLKEAVYLPNMSETVMMNDLQYCFRFMTHYAEMSELNTQLYRVKDVPLRQTFVTRVNQMEKLVGTAQAAIAILLPKQEMFHVQISSEPGLGKTDLSQRLMKELYEEREIQVKKAMKKAGIPHEEKKSGFCYYPSNDSLKFMDNYRHQEIMYVDEANISTELDIEKILMELMMASGAPVISNQASLNDKGKVLNVAIKVSNTNNPFVSPVGLLSSEALWRRRVLFKLTVKKEYQDAQGKLDKKKATTDIMSRSEHLKIEWLDPIKGTAHPESPVSSMEVDDFIYLTRTLYRNHYITQMNRANIKAPRENYLALQHMSNMIHLHNTMLKELDFDRFKNDNKQSAKILQFKQVAEDEKIFSKLPQIDIDNVKATEEEVIMEAIGHEKELLDYYKSIKEIGEFLATESDCDEDCTSVMCTKCNPKARDLIAAMISNAEHTYAALGCNTIDGKAKIEAARDLFKYTENGMLDFDSENIFYELEKIIQDNKHYYVLKPTISIHTKRPGKIDWSRFKIGKIENTDRVLYECGIDDDREAILYHMIDLATYTATTAKAKITIKLEDIKVGEKQNLYMKRLQVLMEDSFNATTSALTSIFRRIYDIISEGFLQGICMAIGVLVMFATLSGIAALLSGTQAYENNAQYTSRNRATKKNIAQYYPNLKIEETPEDGTTHLYKSMLKMVVINSNSKLTGTGVSLNGYVYLINRHIATSITPMSVIHVCDMHKVETDSKNAWTRVNHGKVVFIPDCDLALIVFKDYRMLKSSLKHFITEEDFKDALETFGNTKAKVLMGCDKGCPGTTGLHKHDSAWMDMYTSTMSKHNRVFLYKMYQDKIRPTVGDSGSIIIHDNNRLDHKILGIHCGISHSDPLMAVCGVVTQEEIIAAMQQIPEEYKIQTFPHDGEYIQHSELTKVLKYDQVLMESPIADQAVSKTLGFIATGCFKTDVEVEPAIQSSNDPRIQPGKRHFLEVSLNKDNGDRIPFISTEEEEAAKRYANILIKEHWNWQTVRLYSTEQAVNGVKKNGSRSIEIHTSAGYPYKLRKGVSGKQPMIRWSEEQQKYLIHKEILNDVEYKQNLFKTGIASRDFKIEFRKHELVGHNKIYDKPKTRTVGMGNMVDQIIYDRLFKDLHTGMKSVWRDGSHSFCAIGVDMEVHGQQIVDRLEFVDFVLDYDVVAWEEKFTRQLGRMVLEAKLDVIKEAYKINNCPIPEKLDLMALTLLDDSIYSNVIFEDTIRTRLSGLLSGWPGTGPDNSMAHAMILFIIARRTLIAKNHKRLASPGYISKHVRFVVMSDDICVSLSPELRQYMTAQDIKDGYLELGYEITAPDKTPNIKERHITEVEFLKHYFVKNEVNGSIIYTTKIMPKVIYQLLAYIRTTTKLTIKEQMQVNIADAMRFAFWHGPQFYEELRERINNEFAKHQISWNRDFSEMSILIKHFQEVEQSNNDSISTERKFFTTDFDDSQF